MTQKPYDELKIEEKLDYLGDFIRVVHDALDLHKWIRSYRPWNAKPMDKRHKCDKHCDHHEFYIRCQCGAEMKATKDEYDKAEVEYSGY